MNNTHKQIKPVLVIGCSDSKSEDIISRAIDMYTGHVYKMLRSNLTGSGSTEEIADKVTVLILSGKYGLITMDSFIPNYDQRIPSRQDLDGVAKYVDAHHSESLDLLASVASKETTLFVHLSADYQHCFDKILERGAGSKNLKDKRATVLNQFGEFYISQGHSGIGYFRSDLKRTLTMLNNRSWSQDVSPVYIRSGISNFNELGYAAAGAAVGTSLARVNTKKNSSILSSLLFHAKSAITFIDNGIIRAVAEKREIDTDWIFSEYRKIVSSVPRSVAKNIQIVVPDNPSDPVGAIDILKRHNSDIDWLSSRCDVILPIHSCDNIADQLTTSIATIGHSRFRLGIPCLEKSPHNYCLSLLEIDKLLGVKDVHGDQVIKRVHFFGMSEQTREFKLAPRLALMKRYGLSGRNVTLDCTRTKAVMGYLKNGGLRKGYAQMKLHQESYKVEQILGSTVYRGHDFKAEFLKPHSSPTLTTDLYDLLNEDSIFEFIDQYNDLLANEPALMLPNFVEGEEQEALEMAWQMVSQHYIDVALFQELRKRNAERSIEIKKKSNCDLRFDAFATLFRESGSQQIFQHSFNFDATNKKASAKQPVL
jgi:hypothetical protein